MSAGRDCVDPQGAETDGVGRDAIITHTLEATLYDHRPLALHVQVPINARRDARSFQPLDPGAGAAVDVEGGEMPEHVERLRGIASDPGRLVERALQGFELLFDGESFSRRGLEGRWGN